MHTLYYAPGAASFLVHWLLIELDAPYELQAVDTKAGQQRSAEYLALNPNGVVPTLVTDGKPMFEAAAIALYLAESKPDSALVPPAGSAQRGEFLQWMFHLANAVQPLFRQWWYPHEPAGEANSQVVLEQVRPRIEAAWQRLDAHLAAHGPYLLGGSPSVADFYLAMLLRWSRNMPRPGDSWPRLGALAQALKSRESFRVLYEREGLTEWA